VPDPSSAAPGAGRFGGRRDEAFLHIGVALLGVGLTWALVGTLTFPLAWRSAALSASLSLVIRALLMLVRIGRAEWRSERPPTRAYLPILARFAVAFLLAGVATS